MEQNNSDMLQSLEKLKKLLDGSNPEDRILIDELKNKIARIENQLRRHKEKKRNWSGK